MKSMSRRSLEYGIFVRLPESADAAGLVHRQVVGVDHADVRVGVEERDGFGQRGRRDRVVAVDPAEIFAGEHAWRRR